MTASGEYIDKVVVDGLSLLVVCAVPNHSMSCGFRFPVSRFTNENRGFTEPVTMTGVDGVIAARLAVNVILAAQFIELGLMEFFDTTEITAIPQREREGYIEFYDNL